MLKEIIEKKRYSFHHIISAVVILYTIFVLYKTNKAMKFREKMKQKN